MYDKRPEIKIKETKNGIKGYKEIAKELLKDISKSNKNTYLLAFECYPGVNTNELKKEFFPLLNAKDIIYIDDYAFSIEEVQNKIKDTITEDRVFGVLSQYKIHDFYYPDRLQEVRNRIKNTNGLVIVYGMGTTLTLKPDTLVYADITRWEIQCRFRYKSLTNWKTDNPKEDNIRKFKRGYFFEWRLADRIKKETYSTLDYILDTNQENHPKMIDGESYRKALIQVANAPFRLVPYFDSSIWGGQWMKENFELDSNAINYGWAFDGVPEENSIILNFTDTLVEIPAINVVFQQPNPLLGEKVHSRFGTEFPIRFDYLDTMGGGNLSLQVHPLIEYAQDTFGIHYTQDESYYILESTDKSTVYLGVKEDINKEDLVSDLKKAQSGDIHFPDEKYINIFPVKKHDHVSIPAGTIHCSGQDTVILEISATPYIFTFKLWDWGRTGLDGIPRPVHINHGENNISMERNTTFVNENLISRVDDNHVNLSNQADVFTEKTGLYDLEFIETHRHWFKKEVILNNHSSVNMLNLVEGEQIVIESLHGTFDPFVVNYGETFIVPAAVEEYKIKNNCDSNTKVAVIQAFVRNL